MCKPDFINSYDSGYEHSPEHLYEVKRLVAVADAAREDKSIGDPAAQPARSKESAA